APPFELSRRLDPGIRYIDVACGRAFGAGGRDTGSDDQPCAEAALALARDAGVEMMRAYFDRTPDGSSVFVDAGLWIDLLAEAVADGLTERCLGFVHARPADRERRSRARA